MIFSMIFGGLINAIAWIFHLLPFSLPPMPDVIVGGLGFVLTPLANVVHLLSYAYSPTFFIALTIIGTGVLTFDYVYGFWLWSIRKIPWIDIS